MDTDSTALRCHVCRVSALCLVRNCRSHSNQTMGCATHMMNVHVSHQCVDVTSSVQTENKCCASMACGWYVAQTHVKLPTAPPAFHRTQASRATTIQQTKSTREHDTTSERPPPAVRLTKTANRATIPALPRRNKSPRASTNVTPP